MKAGGTQPKRRGKHTSLGALADCLFLSKPGTCWHSGLMSSGSLFLVQVKRRSVEL